jgi:hypothetical protein
MLLKLKKNKTSGRSYKTHNNMIQDSNSPETKMAKDPLDTNFDLTELRSASTTPNRELTFGEKLVGLTFNPSGDPKVNQAKRLCADLADLLQNEMNNRETSTHAKILEPFTYGEILNAQMNVVKLLTLKY